MDGDIMRCYFNLKYVNCTPDWLMMVVTGHEWSNNDNDEDQMTIFWMFCSGSYPAHRLKYHHQAFPYVLCWMFLYQGLTLSVCNQLNIVLYYILYISMCVPEFQWRLLLILGIFLEFDSTQYTLLNIVSYLTIHLHII